ncbi:MAG: Na/Pi cotransporter family protein, partial [Oscillospiraceae bacterium]
MANVIIAVINLFGGLALFLYGMGIMGNNLEKLAGGKMQKVLEKITSNILLSVLFGMVVTALIQSSSATTVMVVGLVNAGIFKLRQAVGVIMGANIGTTVTAQILRLADLDGSANEVLKFLSPKVLAPIIAIVGILLYMAFSSAKNKTIGQILLGFGILFTGMFAMEGAISQYKDSPLFTQIFSTLTNPIFGVLAGCFVTVLIQSSSASIGILQALSTTGGITFAAAFPIIMGQNIGTCVTPILSSIGANKNAKRAAMVHLYFNIIGTILFLGVFYGLYYTIPNIFPFWDEVMNRGEIANFHALFNIVTTLVLIPFAKGLEKLAIWTVKIKKLDDADDSGDALAALDRRFLSTPSLAIAQCKRVLTHMANLTQKNYRDSIKVLNNYDKKLITKIMNREDDIDIIEDRLGNYIVQLPVKELTDEESHDVTEILQLINEFERIGDYSINIVEKSEYLNDKKSNFSQKG